MTQLDIQDASEGIAALLQRIRPRLLRILSRTRIPASDHEDLLQDALLELVARWPLIHQPEGWLLVTLRHKCLNYLRAHRRLSERFVAIPSDALEQRAAPVDEPSRRLDLAKLVRALPARQQRILWLFYGLGLSEREVALGLSAQRPVPVHSLHKDRWRAVSRLRHELEESRKPASSSD